ILYRSAGNPISGLQDDFHYLAQVLNPTTFRLTPFIGISSSPTPFGTQRLTPLAGGSAVNISSVDTTNGEITTATNHGFNNGDIVTYTSPGSTDIGGLVDGQTYAVQVQTNRIVRLIPAVDLTTNPGGTQTLTPLGGGAAINITSVDT